MKNGEKKRSLKRNQIKQVTQILSDLSSLLTQKLSFKADPCVSETKENDNLDRRHRNTVQVQITFLFLFQVHP